MTSSTPRVSAFEQPTGSFARSVKRLSQPMKRQLASVMDELLSLALLAVGLTDFRNIASLRIDIDGRDVFRHATAKPAIRKTAGWR